MVAGPHGDQMTAQFPFGDRPIKLAMLGMVEGAWSAEIAARIPKDARVIVATHHDKNGDGYAAKIAATLAGRRVERHIQGRQAAQGAQ